MVSSHTRSFKDFLILMKTTGASQLKCVPVIYSNDNPVVFLASDEEMVDHVLHPINRILDLDMSSCDWTLNDCGYTQIEAYYHDKAVDDVAQIDKSSKYPKYLEAAIQKSEMGKGSWYELRFRCQKVEFIATGGIFQSEQGGTKLDAFLSVAVPSFICQDTELLIFPPTNKPESVACVRMLRAQLITIKNIFKKLVLQAMNFGTPDQLRLFEEVPNGFTSMCSHIISLVIGRALTMEKMDELESRMTDFQYYKKIGLNEVPSKDAVLDQIHKIRKKDIAIRSKPKNLLIDIIFSRKMNISNQNLLLLYNGIIYPKVKSINRKCIKELHL
ncbi:hypothetical protein INT47_012044 [Mucor saturninus]|uniref:Uncharacterized protein n=1 Tax=Mucor saturninus TaxID=64648 RepID=A0A8H7UTY5_9FUNG|nr:hypothetical protein INT47_012044 [Mucor saturninus]